MKINHFTNPILTVAVAAALIGSVSAQTLTYNLEDNNGWFAANAWGVDPPPFDQSWVDGSIAAFTAAAGNQIINFSGDAVVQNFNLAGVTGVVELVSTTGPRTLSFSGPLNFSATWGIRQGAGVNIQGDFTLEQGWIRSSSSTTTPSLNQAYVGTATIEGGSIQFEATSQTGSGSRFILDGETASLQIFQNDLSAGYLELNDGTVSIGRTGSTTASASLTVSEFGGDGGLVRRTPNSSITTNTFTVDQVTDTTFAGEIQGLNDAARLQLIKTGNGNLTLSGKIDLIRETQVTGGGLFINGTDTSFSEESGSTAISVNNATLGGTGTINIGEGDNVVLGAGGRLAAGVEGVAGRTTYAFDGGSLNLSAATASANTGWLKFVLGSESTAGVTYDQILLSGGALNIGDGLDFNAFDFTLLSGFGPGTYVLFATDTEILGTLGVVSDELNGYDSTLSKSGNNLVLTVIPEPGAVALMFGSVAFFAIALVRRNRGRRVRHGVE